MKEAPEKRSHKKRLPDTPLGITRESVAQIQARVSAQYRSDEERKYRCDCENPIPGPVYRSERACKACGRFIRK